MSLSAQKNSLFGNAGKKKAAESGTTSTTSKPAMAKPNVDHSNKPQQTASSSSATSSTTSAMKVPTTTGISAHNGTGGLTSTQKAKKLEEAKEFMDKAAQALKKTIFSWKPDHLAAAPQFEYAANAYKLAGELELARTTMLQSVDSHEKADTLGAAALTCVKASQIAQAMGRYDLSSADLERSAELWGIHGDIDKCAETLAKAAKDMGNVNASLALNLYKRACDLICPPDTRVSEMGRLHPSAIAVMRDTFAFMLSDKCNGRKDDNNIADTKSKSKGSVNSVNTIKDGSALAHAKRMVQLLSGFEMEGAMCKTMCAITIIQLSMGDIVQADATFLQDHLNSKQYIVSKECRLAEEFITAIKTHDVDKMDAVLSSTDLNYLEPREVILLSKKLSVFSSTDTATASSSSSGSAGLEKQLYRAADQVARDMEDLMNMAPKLAKDDQGSKAKAKGKKGDKEEPAVTITAATSAAAAATRRIKDDEEDDEEWSPHEPPVSKTTNQQQRIVDDDDDDELDLT